MGTRRRSSKTLARCSKSDLPEYRCHSPYGTSKTLKIFRKSSPKGIAPANRKPPKTRVVTKTAREFRKVWVVRQPLPNACAVDCLEEGFRLSRHATVCEGKGCQRYTRNPSERTDSALTERIGNNCQCRSGHSPPNDLCFELSITEMGFKAKSISPA